MLAVNVSVENGPLIAAGPGLLRDLARIAAGAQDAQQIASRALEDFGEREGVVLADWNPNRPRPRLRIVSEAN